jgi:predicted DsbA family dithiol-disulfide isomerase
MRPDPIIHVWADIVCPFTHVGLRRLVSARDALGRSEPQRALPRLMVHAWPLELVNGAPLDVDFVAHEGAELRRQVAPDLFAGVDPTTFPRSSLAALALVAAAYRRDVQTGEQVSLALRDALFEHGVDVSDPVVLADIAARWDVPVLDDDGGGGDDDMASVIADWRAGQARGVIGSPHFFVGQDGFFCPSLDIRHVDGEFDIRVDEAAFQAFVDQAFGES